MQHNDKDAPNTEGADLIDEEEVASIEEQLLEVISATFENDDDMPPEYLQQCAELSINPPLRKDEIRARCFHLVGGTVIFGVCIAELPDSFLVSSPAVLTSTEGEVEGKAIGSSNIIRLIKSGVSFVSIPVN